MSSQAAKPKEDNEADKTVKTLLKYIFIRCNRVICGNFNLSKFYSPCLATRAAVEGFVPVHNKKDSSATKEYKPLRICDKHSNPF